MVEGLEVCCIAHQLVLVDAVEAVANSNALPQAIGPVCGILLQHGKGGAPQHWQHAVKLRLHAQ